MAASPLSRQSLRFNATDIINASSSSPNHNRQHRHNLHKRALSYNIVTDCAFALYYNNIAAAIAVMPPPWMVHFCIAFTFSLGAMFLVRRQISKEQQALLPPPAPTATASSSSSSAASASSSSSSLSKSSSGSGGKKRSSRGKACGTKPMALAKKVAQAIIATQNMNTITDEEIVELMDAGFDALDEDSARVSVQSPCFVFGDIHGNLAYLLKFFTDAKVEPQLLQLKPPKANLLFLGDYVDRGNQSLEVIALLVSLKVLFPDKLFLLRGNHEIKELNKEYTFHTEVKQKRNKNHKRIYERCNNVFTNLPLCALISNTFLCMHGGLPRPEAWDHLMSDNFEKPLDDDELDTKSVFCDLLWADPTNNSNQLQFDKDFVPDDDFAGDYGNYRYNRARATSIEFNDRFAQKFFNQFPNICAIIRAHEQCAQGYRINEARTICTVFSSPCYETDSDSGSVLKISGDLKRLHFLTLKPTDGLKKDCGDQVVTDEGKNCQ